MAVEPIHQNNAILTSRANKLQPTLDDGRKTTRWCGMLARKTFVAMLSLMYCVGQNHVNSVRRFPMAWPSWYQLTGTGRRALLHAQANEFFFNKLVFAVAPQRGQTPSNYL